MADMFNQAAQRLRNHYNDPGLDENDPEIQRVLLEGFMARTRLADLASHRGSLSDDQASDDLSTSPTLVSAARATENGPTFAPEITFKGYGNAQFRRNGDIYLNATPDPSSSVATSSKSSPEPDEPEGPEQARSKRRSAKEEIADSDVNSSSDAENVATEKPPKIVNSRKIKVWKYLSAGHQPQPRKPKRTASAGKSRRNA